MERPRRPLGDYYQLLLRQNLLANNAPLAADLTRVVGMVSYDSKLVIPNTLFICKGAAFRVEYLQEALAQGAFAYVSLCAYPEVAAPCLQVTDIRRATALLADHAYGHPSGLLQVVGITGTKGKTTTAYYLKSILDIWRAGKKPSAILSTIMTDDGVARRPAKLTTPEPLELQRHLWNAASVNCDYLTMEISSQALKYHRVTGLSLACAVFLNIGEDHISPVEHPDFADYFASKLKIFSMAAAACVNLDCDHGSEVLSAAQVCPRVFTFSAQNPAAKIYATNIRKGQGYLLFHVRTPRYERELCLGMSGLFNVENALAAVAVCEALSVPESAVAEGLLRAAVPGRMEHYTSQDGCLTVIVDYAHNGMSLDALLRSVREEYPGQSVTVLFGCTGGKGLDRRQGMGQAAGQLADRIILTEDDPGPEDVADICRDISRFLTPFGKIATVIANREEAIFTGILDAPMHSVVVLAGKGCEQQQKRRNGPEPCPPDGMLAVQALANYDRRRGAL